MARSIQRRAGSSMISERITVWKSGPICANGRLRNRRRRCNAIWMRVRHARYWRCGAVCWK